MLCGVTRHVSFACRALCICLFLSPLPPSLRWLSDSYLVCPSSDSCSGAWKQKRLWSPWQVRIFFHLLVLLSQESWLSIFALCQHWPALLILLLLIQAWELHSHKVVPMAQTFFPCWLGKKKPLEKEHCCNSISQYNGCNGLFPSGMIIWYSPNWDHGKWPCKNDD